MNDKNRTEVFLKRSFCPVLRCCGNLLDLCKDLFYTEKSITFGYDYVGMLFRMLFHGRVNEKRGEAEAMMEINKENMYQDLQKMLSCILALPEVTKVNIRKIEIPSPDAKEVIWNALEASYHDRFSDVDIHVYVNLHPENCRETLIYHQHPQRLGLNRDHYLGLMMGGLHDTPVLRLVMKNGMRYDLAFHITEDLSAPILQFPQEEDIVKQDGRFWPDWDLKKADAFWFMQIQALGKLYRGDYLIADHIANMQINETLVAQMVMRDDQYGTNIHRYGHGEELDYQNVEGIGKSGSRIIGDHAN